MVEVSTNTAYEPLPVWDCKHVWMNIGCPVRIGVTSNGTAANDEVLEYATLMQKRQCLVCGGFEWKDV